MLRHFQNLIPGLQEFTYNDGIQKELFTLDGTIPVKFRGVTYNIPICVLLQEGHPQVPPLVYVRPTSTMAIKESEHVDTNGRVYHPYLHKWNYKTCNIVAFLRILCGVFGEAPPVYSKPPEEPPPARLAHQPSPSTSADHRPISAHQPEPSTSADARAMQQQPPQEQQKECIVCMDNPRNSVLIPCGHLGVCMECARELHTTLKICPICRKAISKFHQVYDS